MEKEEGTGGYSFPSLYFSLQCVLLYYPRTRYTPYPEKTMLTLVKKAFYLFSLFINSFIHLFIHHLFVFPVVLPLSTELRSAAVLESSDNWGFCHVTCHSIDS